MKKPILLLIIISMIMFISSCDFNVELSNTAGGGGTLEDALLIASIGGGPPREVYILGDIALSDTVYEFGHQVSSTITDWWIIGHIGDDVVYSSTTNLLGVDIYSIEPYTGVSPLDYDIPVNLDAYVNSTPYSFDWWATTVNNHSSHVAPDESSATLWRFNTTGTALCDVYVDLHSISGSRMGISKK